MKPFGDPSCAGRTRSRGHPGAPSRSLWSCRTRRPVDGRGRLPSRADTGRPAVCTVQGSDRRRSRRRWVNRRNRRTPGAVANPAWRAQRQPADRRVSRRCPARRTDDRKRSSGPGDTGHGSPEAGSAGQHPLPAGTPVRHMADSSEGPGGTQCVSADYARSVVQQDSVGRSGDDGSSHRGPATEPVRAPDNWRFHRCIATRPRNPRWRCDHTTVSIGSLHAIWDRIAAPVAR
ncbi:hypothetical protein BH09ACT8_BH09ACT8_18050 [soil metagenome]